MFNVLENYNKLVRNGQVVKSTDLSSKGHDFTSQQPHVGPELSVMRSGTLFWPKGMHADKTLYTK